MVTTEQKLRERLSKHRGVYYQYESDGQVGGIAVWFYQGKFVLTWEECRVGDQYNESNYTRDEVHHISDVDAVFEFLHDAGLELARFRW